MEIRVNGDLHDALLAFGQDERVGNRWDRRNLRHRVFNDESTHSVAHWTKHQTGEASGGEHEFFVIEDWGPLNGDGKRCCNSGSWSYRKPADMFHKTQGDVGLRPKGPIDALAIPNNDDSSWWRLDRDRRTNHCFVGQGLRRQCVLGTREVRRLGSRPRWLHGECRCTVHDDAKERKACRHLHEQLSPPLQTMHRPEETSRRGEHHPRNKVAEVAGSDIAKDEHRHGSGDRSKDSNAKDSFEWSCGFDRCHHCSKDAQSQDERGRCGERTSRPNLIEGDVADWGNCALWNLEKRKEPTHPQAKG